MPATCPSAPTTVPEGQPSRARRAARDMVEWTLANQWICRSGNRAVTRFRSNGAGSDAIDSAVDVDRYGRVRDRAGRDEIGTGFRVCANVLESDASRDF